MFTNSFSLVLSPSSAVYKFLMQSLPFAASKESTNYPVFYFHLKASIKSHLTANGAALVQLFIICFMDLKAIQAYSLKIRVGTEFHAEVSLFFETYVERGCLCLTFP